MKDKITTFLFLFIIFGLALSNILIKDEEISLEERRTLSQFPKVSIQKLFDQKTFDEFETYTLDQFPFRNFFRSLKANTEYHLLQKLDNNDIFVSDSKIFKIEYPMNERSVIRFTEKVNNIKQKYLQDCNVYYAIVPDKNYYLKDEKYLKMDYEKLYSLVQENLQELSYIELRDVLSLEDYYDTDTHWKQENLEKVVNRLEEKMQGKTLKHEYEFHTYQPFYGVYFGQAALGGKGETLTYLTNDIIDSAYVTNSVDASFHEVYNLEQLGKMDSYNVYLSGSTPLITIENSKNKSGKELIIFRDSFASSLSPLLIESYSKITLVDLRYMSASKLDEVIDFNHQDVLFLYSTMVINQSVMLKD